jgi:hypothetical protein
MRRKFSASSGADAAEGLISGTSGLRSGLVGMIPLCDSFGVPGNSSSEQTG